MSRRWEKHGIKSIFLVASVVRIFQRLNLDIMSMRVMRIVRPVTLNMPCPSAKDAPNPSQTKPLRRWEDNGIFHVLSAR